MKQLSIIFFFLMSINALLAQDKSQYGTPEERADKMTKVMTERLVLDKEQVKIIHPINLKYAARAQKEIIDPDMSTWSQYWKVKKIDKEKDKELKPLLSHEQWKAYEKWKAEKMKEMWNRFFE